MCDEHAVRANRTESEAGAPCMLDWKALADQRLSRLVKVEHDCAIFHDRLDRLRSEHDALLLINDGRLESLHALQKSAERYEQIVMELAQKCASMEASRSWRVTAPLRNFSTQARSIKSLALVVLRWVLRRARLGRVFARIAPALHARVRSQLYP
jgi:hypothetical protein